ncbi:hypothetical protein [Desulfoluna sp.]|uniref:hypothetical protein n=1 Tax=Desulfoluna sp. TaxID=2045199 RepID=UPI00262513E9|nr:hypothetical protein [Desulfoluna sp.]
MTTEVLFEHMDKTLTPEPVPESSRMPEGFRSQATDVTRVVHSGLIMRPIYELEMRRFRSDEDKNRAWDVLDLMWIAFAILDSVSELSEYHVGASRTEVLEKVFPAVETQGKASGIDPSEADLYEVLNKIFDHLINRSNRYLPFEYPYFDGAKQQFETRKFWLVKAVYTGQGKTTLFTLTDEGYAAYFGLHETSALDATAIGNLRIKMFIERGNVDDAIAVAEQNQKQCLRKSHDIRNTRRSIQRNIQAVDFERLNDMADEGTHQALQIQQESHRLQHLVSENLQETEDEDLEAKLLHLGAQLKTLNGRQMELVGELQRLPDDYHANSHKLFRRSSLGVIPPPEEILKRVCGMGEEDAAQLGREFISRFDPPVRPLLFDPASIIDAIERALDRQNPEGGKGQAVQEIDGVPIETYQSELTDELMACAFERLGTSVHKDGVVQLSELFTEAAKGAEEATLLPVAIAMGVFQCLVDPRIAERFGVQVLLVDPGQSFTMDLPGGRRYRGHNLTLVPYRKVGTAR